MADKQNTTQNPPKPDQGDTKTADGVSSALKNKDEVDIRKLRTFEDDIKRFRAAGGVVPADQKSDIQEHRNSQKEKPKLRKPEEKTAVKQSKSGEEKLSQPKNKAPAPQVQKINARDREEHSDDFQIQHREKVSDKARPQPNQNSDSAGGEKPKNTPPGPKQKSVPQPQHNTTPKPEKSSGGKQRLSELIDKARQDKDRADALRSVQNTGQTTEKTRKIEEPRPAPSPAKPEGGVGSRPAPRPAKAESGVDKQGGEVESSPTPSPAKPAGEAGKPTDVARETLSEAKPSPSKSPDRPESRTTENKIKTRPSSDTTTEYRRETEPADQPRNTPPAPKSDRPQPARPNYEKETPVTLNKQSAETPETRFRETDREERRDSPLHTFKHDAADRIKQTGTSELGVRLAERRRRIAEGTEPEPETQSGTNRAKVVLTVSFIVVALFGGSWYLFSAGIIPSISIMGNSAGTDSEDTQSSGAKYAIDATDIGREALLESIRGTATEVPTGENAEIRITSGNPPSKITATAFLDKLRVNPPSRLLRAISPDFTLGVDGSTGGAVYIILEARSFENAFAGMFSWEHRMPELVGPVVTDHTSSLQNLPENGLLDTPFIDRLIAGFNARSYIDREGREVLIYAFVRDGKILITGSRESFEAVAPTL